MTTAQSTIKLYQVKDVEFTFMVSPIDYVGTFTTMEEATKHAKASAMGWCEDGEKLATKTFEDVPEVTLYISPNSEYGTLVREIEKPVIRQDYTKTILRERPISGHPDDWYLTVVLGINEKNEFVTWICNSEKRDCYPLPCYAEGHYFGNNYKEALQDYKTRS